MTTTVVGSDDNNGSGVRMVRWRKKGQITQLHATALRTGWSVAVNLPATGTVYPQTMPYTPSCRPHIVNKLTFFSRQVIKGGERFVVDFAIQ